MEEKFHVFERSKHEISEEYKCTVKVLKTAKSLPQNEKI